MEEYYSKTGYPFDQSEWFVGENRRILKLTFGQNSGLRRKERVDVNLRSIKSPTLYPVVLFPC